MPRTGRPPLPFETGYVVAGNGCWIWQRAKDHHGYGLYRGGRAHRFSYTLTNGPIPNGLHILHSCDTPSCVNPSHLEKGTHQDNMRAASDRRLFANQRKTHCPKGHPYSVENTLQASSGGRVCRTCEGARNARAYQRRKEFLR